MPGDFSGLLMLVLFFVLRHLIILLTVDHMVLPELMVVAILPRMFWKNGLKQ